MSWRAKSPPSQLTPSLSRGGAPPPGSLWRAWARLTLPTTTPQQSDVAARPIDQHPTARFAVAMVSAEPAPAPLPAFSARHASPSARMTSLCGVPGGAAARAAAATD